MKLFVLSYLFFPNLDLFPVIRTIQIVLGNILLILANFGAASNPPSQKMRTAVKKTETNDQILAATNTETECKSS